MKISDMIISAVLKKGILYEARNCDMEFEIPMEQIWVDGEQKGKIAIKIKADHMVLKVEKK